MCLIVKQSWFRTLFRMKPKIRTAKKDIVVYKILAEDKFHNELTSYFYNKFHWNIGEVYSSALIVEKSKYLYFIGVGFHSFLNNPVYNCFPSCYTYFRPILCKAIIPKGSKYIIGEENEIVSDHLKIVERC